MKSRQCASVAKYILEKARSERRIREKDHVAEAVALADLVIVLARAFDIPIDLPRPRRAANDPRAARLQVEILAEV